MPRDVIRTVVVDVLNSQRARADATAQEQVVVMYSAPSPSLGPW